MLERRMSCEPVREPDLCRLGRGVLAHQTERVARGNGESASAQSLLCSVEHDVDGGSNGGIRAGDQGGVSRFPSSRLGLLSEPGSLLRAGVRPNGPKRWNVRDSKVELNGRNAA